LSIILVRTDGGQLKKLGNIEEDRVKNNRYDEVASGVAAPKFRCKCVPEQTVLKKCTCILKRDEQLPGIFPQTELRCCRLTQPAKKRKVCTLCLKTFVCFLIFVIIVINEKVFSCKTKQTKLLQSNKLVIIFSSM
jgi:hypothetical protein